MLNNQTPGRAGGIVLIVAAAALWSFSGVGVKLAEMNPLTFTFARSLVATAALAMLLPISRGWRPFNRWMVLAIVVYTAVATLAISAMTLGTAAQGILLQYTGPAFCALFAWIFQGRRISRVSIVAIAIASGGIGIMLVGSGGPGGWLATVIGIASGAALGALVLVLEKVDRISNGRGDSIWIVFVNNAGASVLLLPLVLIGGSLEITQRQILIVAVLGVVQLALPYVLFQLGLRRIQPVAASLLVLAEPLLNPIWVALMTTERPDTATMIGGGAILIAMVIEAFRPRRVQGKFAMVEVPPDQRADLRTSEA